MSSAPYVGLRSFKRDEIDIFFGRETHRNQLIDILREEQFLAVVGYSGCGKSSLVKTSLVAGLEAGLLVKAGINWHIVDMRPGNHPFKNLAEKLYVALKDLLYTHFDSESLKHTLQQGSLSLHKLLIQHPLPNNARLLIICDQFEEIFRYYEQGAKPEAINFVDLLLSSSKPFRESNEQKSDSIYVVITMRSEYIGDCAKFMGLAEAINTSLFFTPRLYPEQLRKAIETPAMMFGTTIAPELTEQLLHDAENNPDQLPLLQHVLMRMWYLAQQKDGNPKKLSLKDYKNEKIGGLNNALSNHANEIYNNLTDDQKRLAEVLFRNLTENDSSKRDTRRPIQFQEIIELTNKTREEIEALIEVISRFRQEGCSFLMLSPEPESDELIRPETIIDISHESLIRQWNLLKEWTEDEANSADIYRRLEERALLHKQDKANFYEKTELSIAQSWFYEKKPTPQWASRYGTEYDLAKNFLKASQEDEYARRVAEYKKKQAEQAKERLLETQKNLLNEEQQKAKIREKEQMHLIDEKKQSLEKKEQELDEIESSYKIAKAELARERQEQLERNLAQDKKNRTYRLISIIASIIAVFSIIIIVLKR